MFLPFLLHFLTPSEVLYIEGTHLSIKITDRYSLGGARLGSRLASTLAPPKVAKCATTHG